MQLRSTTLLLAGLAIVGLVFGLRRWNRVDVSTLEGTPSDLMGIAQPQSDRVDHKDAVEIALDRGDATMFDRAAGGVIPTTESVDATAGQPQPDGRAPAKPGRSTEYGEMSLEQLIGERQTISGTLIERSNPIILQRFRDNLAEFVSMDQKYEVTDADSAEIVGIQQRPGEGTFRTVLPRSEYAELYELKDLQLMLNELIHEKSVEFVRAKR